MEKKPSNFKINIEKDNNVVTFAEFDQMEVAVHLALDLHKVSNIRHTIRVVNETETIISFYA